MKRGEGDCGGEVKSLKEQNPLKLVKPKAWHSFFQIFAPTLSLINAKDDGLGPIVGSERNRTEKRKWVKSSSCQSPLVTNHS